MVKEIRLPISVCICTLNAINEIKECLNSVIKNNVAEIIVVDASSKDGTYEYLKNQEIRLFKCEKLGLAYQRQLSIEKATQEYIAIVDSQDVLDDNSDSCCEILIVRIKITTETASYRQNFTKKFTINYFHRFKMEQDIKKIGAK